MSQFSQRLEVHFLTLDTGVEQWVLPGARYLGFLTSLQMVECRKEKGIVWKKEEAAESKLLLP